MSRLLFEGRAYLPEEYPTPTGMTFDETQQQHHQNSSSPPHPGHMSPTKPSLQPKPAEGYDSDHSDGLSRGPTPAPTPEVQRATRDISDASSEEANTLVSLGGDPFDDLGGEEKTNSSAAVARQVSSNGGKGQQQSSAATAASSSAAASFLLSDENILGAEKEEGKEEAVVGKEESLSGEEDNNERRGGERKENEIDQAHGGIRHETKEEEIRGKTEVSSSSTGSFSGLHLQRDKLLEPDDALRKGDGFDGDDGDTSDENKDYDSRRSEKGKVERLSPLSTSAIVVATTTTSTTLEEDPGRKSPPREPRHGENNSDKDRLGGEEGGKEEEEMSEIEEEDDGVPDDSKSDDFEEGRSRSSSSQAACENGEEHPDDDGGKALRSQEDDIHHSTADILADTTFASGGDDAIAARRIRATSKDGDLEQNSLPSSRATEREAGGRGSDTPAGASPPPAPRTATSPTAVTSTITSPTSGKRDATLSLSSNLAPSSVLTSPLSSPPLSSRGGSSLSSLAGLPLPPMGGGRPRLGLLGSLPPVGGRGLPSLALIAGEKAYNAGEEGEVATRTVDTCDGDASDDAVTKVTDTSVSAELSTPLSSGGLLLGTSAARSPTVEKEPASITPGPLRLSPTPTTRDGSSKETNENNINSDTGEDSGREDPAPLLPTRNVGGQEKKEEESAFRARLGLGEDEESDNEEETDGGGEIGQEFVGAKRNSNTSSPPGSPKQHQGQEEENAGRTPSVDPNRKEEVGSPVGGGGYFGGSDEANELEEVSSVDEDISFEQESVNSGEGGSDDYFS